MVFDLVTLNILNYKILLISSNLIKFALDLAFSAIALTASTSFYYPLNMFAMGICDEIMVAIVT